MKYDFELSLDKNTSLGKIIDLIQDQSTILEFGPGNGRMTQYLQKEKKCEVSIVEFDEELLEAASVFSCDQFLGNIEDLEWCDYFKEKKFDYIIFADVLEHLRYPEKILLEVQKFLGKHGRILISFPNITHNSVLINLFNNRFEYDEYGILDETHLRFYDQNTFFKLFKKLGLNIILVDYTFAEVGNNFIKNSYDDLPLEVQFPFKLREYGEVFQYIFMLEKQNNDKVNTPIIKPVKNTNWNKTIKIHFELFDGRSKEEVYLIEIKEDEWIKLEFCIPEDTESFTVFFGEESCIIRFKEQTDSPLYAVCDDNVIQNENTYFFITNSPCIQFKTENSKTTKEVIFFRFEHIGKVPSCYERYIMRTSRKMKEDEETLKRYEYLKNKYNKMINTKRFRLIQTAKNYYNNMRLLSASISKKKDSFIYNIDSFTCVSSNHYVLTGWGYSALDKRALKYVNNDDQIISFIVHRFMRKDVGGAFENEKLGFSIDIKTIKTTPYFWLQLIDSKKNYCAIKLNFPKQKNK